MGAIIKRRTAANLNTRIKDDIEVFPHFFIFYRCSIWKEIQFLLIHSFMLVLCHLILLLLIVVDILTVYISLILALRTALSWLDLCRLQVCLLSLLHIIVLQELILIELDISSLVSVTVVNSLQRGLLVEELGLRSKTRVE